MRRPCSTTSPKGVTELIAKRVRKPGESYRAAEDRFRKHIQYDVDQGKLECESHGAFSADNVGQWARNAWPGKFDDLRIIATAAGSMTSGSDTCSGTLISLPKTLEESAAMIAELFTACLAFGPCFRGRTARKCPAQTAIASPAHRLGRQATTAQRTGLR